MGQIAATRNLVATKVVRLAGQQTQLQDKMRNIYILGSGAPYIRALTVIVKKLLSRWQAHHSWKELIFTEF